MPQSQSNPASIELNALFEKPDLAQTFMLRIDPLAPLSMVSSLPGSYYRSERAPTEFMLYGLLENLLGWHFPDGSCGPNIRGEILKAQKQLFKKSYKLELQDRQSEVGYLPLIQHHLVFEELLVRPQVSVYVDLWKQHQKAGDSRHMGGCTTEDWRISAEIRQMNEINERRKTEKDLAEVKADDLFKVNFNYFPNYYSSPTPREFLVTQGYYAYRVKTSKSLFLLLEQALERLDTPLYLGNSEGWIELQIQSL